MKDPRNIKDYENLREILGKELGESLYDIVDVFYNLDREDIISLVKRRIELNYDIRLKNPFVDYSDQTGSYNWNSKWFEGKTTEMLLNMIKNPKLIK